LRLIYKAYCELGKLEKAVKYGEKYERREKGGGTPHTYRGEVTGDPDQITNTPWWGLHPAGKEVESRNSDELWSWLLSPLFRSDILMKIQKSGMSNFPTN
jgi:hypothetical protein